MQHRNMKNATMLYKWGGPHKLHGGSYHYIIVDASSVDEKLSEGWYTTTDEAKKAHETPVVLKPEPKGKK